jgi:3-dehydroquinate dehydratase/shikimate dehydrogenase
MSSVTVTHTRSAGLCATVGGATTADLRRARDGAAATADLVELRLDSVADPDPEGALQGRRGPVLVTCRPTWEGGGFRGSEEARLAILDRAWALGAEYVDLESRAAGAPAFLARTRGERVVLSEHHFDRVPKDLDARLAALCASPAAVVKVAVAAGCLRDTLPLFAWGRAQRDRGIVALAMGMPGLPTRVLAAHAGSCWTYAGNGWAPGQLPMERLLGEFRYRSVTPATRVYAVLGRPIGHSLSPALHNAAFDAQGDDAVYVPLEASDVDDFLAFADALGIAGVSVTAPFKVALAAHATLDEAAERVGALNTLGRGPDGRWRATNTDVEGFLAPLEGRLPLGGARAAVLGTGGAARAVAFALGRRGARVTVHGRDVGRGARGRHGRRVDTRSGLVGPARERDADRHRAAHRRDAPPRRALRRHAGLRPRLQPADHAPAGRRGRRGVRRARRARHAGGAGAGAAGVLARTTARGRGDARRGAGATRGRTAVRRARGIGTTRGPT